MSISQFIDKYYNAARAVSTQTLPPAFILAHAYLESGRGTSQLTIKGNNFFGIKAIPGQPFIKMNTREIINGKPVVIAQNFRKYESPINSFKAYVNLLSSNRYKKVIEARTHSTRAQELKKAGYFTAGDNYIKALTNTAQKFDQAISARPNYTMIPPLVAALLLAGYLVYSNK
jgi:flagellum-specific peptidoglycan hydrolase FlgJ